MSLATSVNAVDGSEAARAKSWMQARAKCSGSTTCGLRSVRADAADGLPHPQARLRQAPLNQRAGLDPRRQEPIGVSSNKRRSA